jgi:hypothetical protein
LRRTLSDGTTYERDESDPFFEPDGDAGPRPTRWMPAGSPPSSSKSLTIAERLTPSQQTLAQARNFTIMCFRDLCDFDGVGVPSVAAVEAVLDVKRTEQT